ncbi:MAG: SDR family NAD(P)-dependent oxidoreductase [Verrucomicrobiales bacterium]|nr:SDR family NAD(P)-dependent oxidoreductase [Verrucomicrobiales bacterium]
MEKVLLTGAAGFIASRVAAQLLDQGVEVVAIDNFNDAYDVRLKHHRMEALRGRAGLTFIEGDIESKALVDQVFAEHRFDTVFNLAARAGVRYSIENPDVYFSTNVDGTRHLLQAMRFHGVKKFLLASTSSLYAGTPMPFNEETPVDRPLSPYAASKKAAEVLAYTYHHLFGLDVSILRFFTVYGPAGRPDMAPFRFIRWIDEGTTIEMFGDGSQARDFTYVDDIARGTILAAKPLGYEIINLGGGQRPTTLMELIAAMEERLGRKAVIDHKPFNKADMMETWADISKAKRLLGWEPEIPLEEGLDRTIGWYRDNRDLARALVI